MKIIPICPDGASLSIHKGGGVAEPVLLFSSCDVMRSCLPSRTSEDDSGWCDLAVPLAALLNMSERGSLGVSRGFFCDAETFEYSRGTSWSQCMMIWSEP